MEEAPRAAETALALAERLAAVAPGVVAEIEARAHYTLADAARVTGQAEAARHHWQQSLKAARRGGLRRVEYRALGNLGGLLYDAGRLEESYAVRQQAYEGAAAIGDSHAAAYFLTHLAANERAWGETEAALSKLAQAAQMLVQMGDEIGLATAENQMASLLLSLNRPAEAQALVEGLLQRTEETANSRMRAFFLDKLALIQMVAGEAAAAEATLRQALALPAAESHRTLRAALQGDMAVALLAQGETEAAVALLAEEPAAGAAFWVGLDRQLLEAVVALARGETEKARGLATAAAAQAEAIGYRVLLPRAERILAALEQRPAAAALLALLFT
jgi:hypothetical protein